jgi:hypothetical protein
MGDWVLDKVPTRVGRLISERWAHKEAGEAIDKLGLTVPDAPKSRFIQSLVRAAGERQVSTGSQAGRSGAISATCSADDAAGQQVEVDR